MHLLWFIDGTDMYDLYQSVMLPNDNTVTYVSTI